MAYCMLALGSIASDIGVDDRALARLAGHRVAVPTRVASDDVMRDLQADIDQGKRRGVTGTPTVFINGRKMSSFLAQTLATIIDHIVLDGDR